MGLFVVRINTNKKRHSIFHNLNDDLCLDKMEEEVSGLQEAGDIVEETVREAEKDLEALNVLLDHARLEERNMKRTLYQTYRKGELCTLT